MRAAPSGLSCRSGCTKMPRPLFPPLLSTHWTLSFYGDPQCAFLQTGTTCQYGQRARRRGGRRGELPTSSTTSLPILNEGWFSGGSKHAWNTHVRRLGCMGMQRHVGAAWLGGQLKTPMAVGCAGCSERLRVPGAGSG